MEVALENDRSYCWFETIEEGEVVRVKVFGELTTFTQVRKEIFQLIGREESSGKKWVFDFSEAVFVDAAGLEMLIMCQFHHRPRIAVVPDKGSIHSLYRVFSKTYELPPLFNTIGEAKQHLNTMN